MRQKTSSTEEAAAARETRRRRRIRSDLESLGMSPLVSEPVAERIDAVGAAPGSDAYRAALDGAAAAWQVYRGDCESLEQSSRDIAEIQRLMQGFAGELRKLEEGLRIVSAYVLRMHDKASRERRGAIH
jgi:hypothetical protein